MKDYIFIEKIKVTASKEVCTAYYKMKNQEEYGEKVRRKKEKSYDYLVEEGFSVESNMRDLQILIEDDVVEKMMIAKLVEEKMHDLKALIKDEVVKKIMIKKLKLALEKLTQDELMLIQDTF